MNTNMIELNMEEMEAVSGGWNWKKAFIGMGCGFVGGAATGALYGICCGPVGMAVGAAVGAVGGAAIGTAAGGTRDD